MLTFKSVYKKRISFAKNSQLGIVFGDRYPNKKHKIL